MSISELLVPNTLNIFTENITIEGGIVLPNTTEASSGNVLTYYSSQVVPTVFGNALGNIPGNLRFSRIGKTVNLSIDGLSPSAVSGQNATIDSSVSIPSAFLPDFTNSNNGVVLGCFLVYLDTANPGGFNIPGALMMQTTGAFQIHPLNVLSIQSMTEIGLNPTSTFITSAPSLPTGAAVGWRSMNFSWYAGN